MEDSSMPHHTFLTLKIIEVCSVYLVSKIFAWKVVDEFIEYCHFQSYIHQNGLVVLKYSVAMHKP